MKTPQTENQHFCVVIIHSTRGVWETLVPFMISYYYKYSGFRLGTIIAKGKNNKNKTILCSLVIARKNVPCS